jgi:hypothetical protein
VHPPALSSRGQAEGAQARGRSPTRDHPRRTRHTQPVPSPTDRAELAEFVDRYLSGEHSRQLVSEIEGMVLQSFQDADWSDEVGTALALYSPADHDAQYVNDAQLEVILRGLRARL